MRAETRRTDCDSHDEDSVPAGETVAGAAHLGPHRAVQYDIRNHGAQNSRATGAYARSGRVRPSARYCGDYSEPLATWLCLRIQLAFRFVLAGRRRASLRGGKE